MAASSAGSAWSQPHRWSAPWTTRRRSSSAGDQRTISGLAATARLGLLDGPLHGDHDVAEVEACPGREEERRAGVRTGAWSRAGAAAGHGGRAGPPSWGG